MATSLWTFLVAITSISPLPHTMIRPQYNSPYAPLYLLSGYSADNHQRLRLASSVRPGTAEASGYIRVSTYTGYIYPVLVGHQFLSRLNTAIIHHALPYQGANQYILSVQRSKWSWRFSNDFGQDTQR
ncbi:hypothetical protein B0J17DRAFT_426930 [Rhizoctonia solani]|nr:hypothetical protein B0J17DRAFT_426930 [Rhizoctonia solani]